MRRMLVIITGFAAFTIYVVFTALAFSKYPDAYSPVKNWLSDLGNPLINQSGALLYNLGCVLTSIVLIFFVIFLSSGKQDTGKENSIVKL
jgi:hypothetical membrane protein